MYAVAWSKLSEEVRSTVDEVEQKKKGTRGRVMRAADVMPPFRQRVPAPNEGDAPSRPPGCAVAKQGGNGDEAKAPAVEDANSAGNGLPTSTEAPAMFVEIPKFDLAENILAEQRRTAARRRRAPGKGDGESLVSADQTGPRLPDPEPSTHDLFELQQIVAQIVARDIERLCKGSGTQLPV